jgi:hypothetical protein
MRRTGNATVEDTYARVVQALTKDPDVSHGGANGFGAGALKVDGKIFAMISSKEEFVVKLPKGKVAALVKTGKGERFNPGRGRIMKEWLAVRNTSLDWIEIAREACEFVKQGKRSR